MPAVFPSWVQPQTLTVFAPLPAGADLAALRAKLETPRAAERLRLGELGALHYLRIFVIEPAADLRGRPLPGRLVLSVVGDGRIDALLDDWIARAAPAIVEVFGGCAGFPVATDTTGIRDWFLAHAERPNTFYVGAVRGSAATLRDEAQLHAAIQIWLDAEQAAGRIAVRGAVEIHQAIRAHVRGRADLPQGLRPSEPRFARLRRWLDRTGTVALLLAAPAALAWFAVSGARDSVWIFLAGFVAFASALVLGYALTIRLLEWLEPEVELPPASAAHFARVVTKEDHLLQNQFTMLSLVRGSWARRLNLRLVLFLSNALSRHWWNRGELVGIGTIHFARIHQIDGGRRMLFLSDFDGSWERYLFDFLDVGAFAVVPNWTNLHGCPPARFGLRPTPGFARKFLPFTRANQLATELWYCALPELSVPDVLRNARIRAGLFDTPDESAARAWLALF